MPRPPRQPDAHVDNLRQLGMEILLGFDSPLDIEISQLTAEFDKMEHRSAALAEVLRENRRKRKIAWGCNAVTHMLFPRNKRSHRTLDHRLQGS
jgi:hypothetical protein